MLLPKLLSTEKHMVLDIPQGYLLPTGDFKDTVLFREFPAFDTYLTDTDDRTPFVRTYSLIRIQCTPA